MSSPFLSGSKVDLRPHLLTDTEAWASWFNDPRVTRFLEQGYSPTTPALQAARLDQLYSAGYPVQNLQLAIVDHDSGQLVGTVGLHQLNWVNRSADISIVIGEQSAQGKGFGKEAVGLLIQHAFATLNLRKLTAGMVDPNKASFHLFTSLGFTSEALLKEHVFLEGTYHDVHKLALFVETWCARRRK